MALPIAIVSGVLFSATMGASACSAMFPGTYHLAAPFACPSGTVKSVVVITRRSTNRGGSSTRGDLYCMDREGGGHVAGTFSLLGTLFLMYLIAAGVVGGLVLVAVRLGLARSGASATLLVLLLLMNGCGWGTMTGEEFDRAYPYGRGDTFTHAGGKRALAAYHAILGAGPIHVTELMIDPQEVAATVQDPKREDNFDQYVYRDGEMRKPSPEKIGKKDRQRIADRLFDLEAAPLDKIPEVMAAALDAAKVDGGHVNSIQLSRGLEGGDVTIVVRVESPRDEVRVKLDTSLHVLETKEKN
jgi:hypothetical protein